MHVHQRRGVGAGVERGSGGTSGRPSTTTQPGCSGATGRRLRMPTSLPTGADAAHPAPARLAPWSGNRRRRSDGWRRPGEGVPWRAWGPYLSERQWGTVREDYSENGDAWSYFSHDQARSRAYRWGEDGLAGISDEQPAAVLRAGALERARPDPEGAPVRADQHRGQPRRGRQGVLLLRRQHAEPRLPALALQVPAGGVPVRRSRRRRTAAGLATEMEYELLDTGVFDDDRYFDVEVEYAKAEPRGHRVPHHRPQPRSRGRTDPSAADAVVPQHVVVGAVRPQARRCAPTRRATRSSPIIHELGTWYLHAESPDAELLFCDNETNATRLWNSRELPGAPEGRDQRLRRRRPRRRREPRPHGHQGGGAHPARRRPPAPARPSGCGSTAPRPTVRDRFADAADVIAAPARRGRRVLRRDHAGRRERRRGGGHAPGAGRDAVVEADATTSTSTSGCASAAATRCDRRARQGTRNESWFHGCGKSTLLNIIAGFLAPTGGEIRIGGKLVNRPRHGPRRRVPGFRPTVPVAHGSRQLAFGLEMKGVARMSASRIAREQLRLGEAR